MNDNFLDITQVSLTNSTPISAAPQPSSKESCHHVMGLNPQVPVQRPPTRDLRQQAMTHRNRVVRRFRQSRDLPRQCKQRSRPFRRPIERRRFGAGDWAGSAKLRVRTRCACRCVFEPDAAFVDGERNASVMKVDV